MNQDYTPDIGFPLSTEPFIGIQQREIGRNLEPEEQEICKILVPFLNDTYENGRSGKGRYPLKYEDFMAEVARTGEHVNGQFCLSLCAWVNFVWASGRCSASAQEVVL